MDGLFVKKGKHMKHKSILLMLLFGVLPILCMDLSSSSSDDSSHDSKEISTTDSASFDGPKLTLPREVEKMKRVVLDVSYEVFKEADDYDRAEELTVLYGAYGLYREYFKNEESKGKIHLFHKDIDHNALTSKRLIAATWLELIEQDHKEWFKNHMFLWAAAAGHYDTLKYLSNREGVYVNTPNLVGDIPLYIACEKGHLQIVEYLVKHGALHDERTREAYCEQAIRKAQNNLHNDIAEKLKEYMQEQPDKRKSPRILRKCTIN